MSGPPDWTTILLAVLGSLVTVSVALFFAYRGNLEKRLDKIDEQLGNIGEKIEHIKGRIEERRDRESVERILIEAVKKSKDRGEHGI